MQPTGGELEGPGRRGKALVVIGLLAVGAAWGLNYGVIWQLEQHAPEPKAPVTRVDSAPTVMPAPMVSPGFIVEQDSVEDPQPDDQSDDQPGDQPDDQPREPASAGTVPSKPAAPKSAASKSTASKPAASRPASSKPTSSKQAPRMRVFTLDVDRLKQQFKRPEDTAGHGHVLPHYRDGERRGLQFADVAPGGLFGRLGIESGDVILSVNGTKITTQQKALSDFEKMRELRTFDVVLERQGDPRHFRYVLK